MTSALQAIQFEAPPVNPAPNGLYNATTWAEVAAGDPSRFMAAGVQMRPHNYGGESSFGVWDADWCSTLDELTVDDVKKGTRPNPLDLDEFVAMVVWAYDQCDLTLPSQREVTARATQNLRLLEQNAVEHEFADRLLDDVTSEGITTATASDFVGAVSHLEAEFARTNTLGLVHANPMYAAVAAANQLLIRSGSTFTTPLGHRWVFGGGYIDTLETTLVGTSPTFGWRDEVQVRTVVKQEWNQFVAVAERAVLIGYEAVVAAVDVT